ncbi:MAG: hypothetical protein INQ03_10285 [Candidatus Heimdallarchaeota archaeon]|nr:hypothetical protein [Candidatus Heimdallarchaeota archaeon]
MTGHPNKFYYKEGPKYFKLSINLMSLFLLFQFLYLFIDLIYWPIMGGFFDNFIFIVVNFAVCIPILYGFSHLRTWSKTPMIVYSFILLIMGIFGIGNFINLIIGIFIWMEYYGVIIYLILIVKSVLSLVVGIIPLYALLLNGETQVFLMYGKAVMHKNENKVYQKVMYTE